MLYASLVTRLSAISEENVMTLVMDVSAGITSTIGHQSDVWSGMKAGSLRTDGIVTLVKKTLIAAGEVCVLKMDPLVFAMIQIIDHQKTDVVPGTPPPPQRRPLR